MEHVCFQLNPEEPCCYIFGAGGFYGMANRLPRAGTDYVIAADGGLMHLQKLGIRPDLCLGDFDSLPEEVLPGRTNAADAAEGTLLTNAANIANAGNAANDANAAWPAGASAVKIPVQRLSRTKEWSDSSMALKEAEARGYRVMFLYGLSGGRLDHTLASLQDIAALSKKGILAYLFTECEVFFALTDRAVVFPDGMRGLISVFSHSGESLGVTESGLKYTVVDHSLTNDTPLGLSNEFTSVPAVVSVRKGTLLISVESNRGLQ